MNRSCFVVLLGVAMACGASATRDGGPSDGGVLPDGGVADAGIRRDAGGSSDAGTEDPLGLCPPGVSLRHYSLSSLATLPAVSELELPSASPGFRVTNAGDGSSHSVRFDICDTPTGPTLQAILYRSDSFSTPRIFVVDDTLASPIEDFVDIPEGFVERVRLPPDFLVVEGLASALTGAPASLRVRAVFDSGLLVYGHADFVAVARGRVGRTTVEYTSVEVIVGALVMGDVFSALQCAFGEDEHHATFRLGTASFEVDSCTFLGGGFTTGYRIHRLKIVDSNAALDPAERVAQTFVSEAEVEAVMTYQWNHHNACDSFAVALPHADYAASAAPAAGCGPTVPNAPVRDINDPSNSPVAYRIRYDDGAWTDGTIPGCTHYLFCN